MKEFDKVALELVNELMSNIKDYSKITQLRILNLKWLIHSDPRKFVKEYKKISGATDWDLPDIIYSKA